MHVHTVTYDYTHTHTHLHLHIHLRYLVSVGCIKPLCNMLTVQDSRVVQITIEGLENILKVGQTEAAKNNGVNPFSVLIEEAYGRLLRLGFGLDLGLGLGVGLGL